MIIRYFLNRSLNRIRTIFWLLIIKTLCCRSSLFSPTECGMKILNPSPMRIAILLSFAHMCHHLCTATLFPMLPLIRDGMSLNYFQSGLLVSSFSVFYGFGQIPMAMLADRMNRGTILIFGMIGTALSTMGVGLTWKYWQMFLCFSSLGLMGATYHAPAASLISDRVSVQLRGRTLGTHTIGGCSGFLAAPILAVALAHWSGNWRWAFIIMAAPALLCAILLRLGPFTISSQHEHDFQGALQESPGYRNQIFSPTEKGRIVSYLDIIKKIGLLAGMSMIIYMVYASVSSFFPLYLVDHHGLSSESAGLMVAILFGAGIIGAPAGGVLSDRLGRKAVILLSLVLSGPLLMGITLVSKGILLIFFLLTFGMVTIARAPVMESLIADVTPSQRRATVLGFYYLINQETSGILTPVVGYLVDYQGPNFAFTTLAIALSIAGILALVFRNKIR